MWRILTTKQNPAETVYKQDLLRNKERVQTLLTAFATTHESNTETPSNRSKHSTSGHFFTESSFMISSILKKFSGRHYKKYLKKCQPIIARINEIEIDYQSMSDDQLRAKTEEFMQRY